MTWRKIVVLLMAALALIAAGCSAETSVKAGERVVLDDDRGQPDDGTTTPDDAAETPTADTQADADDAEGESDDAAPTDDADDAAPTPDPSETETDPADDDDLPRSASAAVIEGLVVDCEADNDMACDILYRVTARGSDEEAIALDCGGRGKPANNTFCTEGLTVASPDEPDFFALTSPALPDITDACQIGDMTACDFLFWMSPLDSEFETIGQTCAGRIEVADPDCRTVFGT